MVGAAIAIYVLVPPANVVAGHGGYGNPLSPSFGENDDFKATSDPVQPDLGLAGILGWTQPANNAVDPDVTVPNYGPGTASLDRVNFGTPYNVVAGLVGFEGSDDDKATQFEIPLAMASSLMANVSSKCTGLAALDEDTRNLIQNNLAAHFYSQKGHTPGLGQLVKSDQVGDGVGRTWTAPTGVKGHGLQSTTFGQMALMLDVSGCLAAHEASAVKPRRKAQVKWLGKRGRHYR